MNVSVLEKLEATSKKNEKVKLLKQLDEQGRRLVALALDQNVTFGITVDVDDARLFKSIKPMKNQEFWDSFEALLPHLAKRELTGNAAEGAVWRVLQQHPTDLDAKWAARILNRQLRAGFDIRTFNAAFGEGSIKKFEVQLADTYEGQQLEGEWGFEPKLDGNRVVGYRGNPTSRGNKLYPAAEPIFETMRRLKGFFPDWVPDGEMMGDLGFDKSSGALRRSSDKGKKKANFTYWLFDMFTLSEYDSQETEILRVRKERLDQFFRENGALLPNVKPVPWFVVKNPTHKQIMGITQKFVKDGFEGAMAKRMDAPAKFGRGPDLLKVKLFFEDEFKVTGFYEGDKGSQHQGTLGGIVIEGTIKWAPHPDAPRQVYHIRSECGSGFAHVLNEDDPDQVLRDEVWNNKKDWLGATVQIQFQSPTEKKNPDGTVSLRLPVFIMRRKDKE